MLNKLKTWLFPDTSNTTTVTEVVSVEKEVKPMKKAAAKKKSVTKKAPVKKAPVKKAPVKKGQKPKKSGGGGGSKSHQIA